MNRQALITGGTKGIGLSVAKRLMQEGFDVVLTYNSDAERAHSVERYLTELYPTKVFLLSADISDLGSIDLIYNFLRKNDIELDALILNAALTDRTSFLEMELDAWKRIFDANIHFPVFLIQKLFPLLKINSSVIFTGSLMGIQPHAMSLSYGVTKSSVHSLVKNLVKFLTPKGVRVNAVAPGFVDTEWQKEKPAEVKASINAKVAVGRFCEPDELADIYWMLINNRYINGEVVVADGGYLFK